MVAVGSVVLGRKNQGQDESAKPVNVWDKSGSACEKRMFNSTKKMQCWNLPLDLIKNLGLRIYDSLSISDQIWDKSGFPGAGTTLATGRQNVITQSQCETS